MAASTATKSTDILSLHVHESRFDQFKRAPDIFFSDKLNQWIVVRPELVVELLRDDRLLVPSVVDAIHKVETHYKRDFSNLEFAARCIPLLLDGQIHREIRRNLADMVTEGRARTAAALPSLMARYVEPMDQQTNPDWMTSSLIPLVSAAFCHMCDVPEPLPFPKLVLTRLFDRFVSLAALDAAERQIGHFRQELAKTTPNIDPSLVFALFILGRDSLLGTLATSLYSVVRQNLNRRFADIEFPEFPPETGVAIAERTAASDIALGTVTIAAGATLRMYFQPISFTDSSVARQNLFGAGTHSCLGRPISLDVWRALIKTLNGFSCRVTSVSCEFEPNNVFVMPRYLTTEQVQ